MTSSATRTDSTPTSARCVNSIAVETANWGMNCPRQRGHEAPQPCSDPVSVTVSPAIRTTNIPSAVEEPEPGDHLAQEGPVTGDAEVSGRHPSRLPPGAVERSEGTGAAGVSRSGRAARGARGEGSGGFETDRRRRLGTAPGAPPAARIVSARTQRPARLGSVPFVGQPGRLHASVGCWEPWRGLPHPPRGPPRTRRDDRARAPTMRCARRRRTGGRRSSWCTARPTWRSPSARAAAASVGAARLAAGGRFDRWVDRTRTWEKAGSLCST